MVVVLSVLRALLRRASAVERALPERSARKVVLAERRWLVSEFQSGPADLLAGSSPPIPAEGLVVGLGDAPSNACMSGR